MCLHFQSLCKGRGSNNKNKNTRGRVSGKAPTAVIHSALEIAPPFFFSTPSPEYDQASALSCGVEVTISIFLSGDYEFLCKMYGLSGANGIYVNITYMYAICSALLFMVQNSQLSTQTPLIIHGSTHPKHHS